jgi:hypothetical protein
MATMIRLLLLQVLFSAVISFSPSAQRHFGIAKVSESIVGSFVLFRSRCMARRKGVMRTLGGALPLVVAAFPRIELMYVAYTLIVILSYNPGVTMFAIRWNPGRLHSTREKFPGTPRRSTDLAL